MFIGEDREPARLKTFIRVKCRTVHLLKLLHRILILSNPILILVCCDFGSDSSVRINKTKLAQIGPRVDQGSKG